MIYDGWVPGNIDHTYVGWCLSAHDTQRPRSCFVLGIIRTKSWNDEDGSPASWEASEGKHQEA